MTLHEFLKVCGKDDYVGIHDIDAPFDKKYKLAKRFEVMPTQQHYMKIGNIPYGRIRYFLDKEVCGVHLTEKGYFVQIHTPGRAKARLDQRELARLIGEEIRRAK